MIILEAGNKRHSCDLPMAWLKGTDRNSRDTIASFRQTKRNCTVRFCDDPVHPDVQPTIVLSGEQCEDLWYSKREIAALRKDTEKMLKLYKQQQQQQLSATSTSSSSGGSGGSDGGNNGRDTGNNNNNTNGRCDRLYMRGLEDVTSVRNNLEMKARKASMIKGVLTEQARQLRHCAVNHEALGKKCTRTSQESTAVALQWAAHDAQQAALVYQEEQQQQQQQDDDWNSGNSGHGLSLALPPMLLVPPSHSSSRELGSSTPTTPTRQLQASSSFSQQDSSPPASPPADSGSEPLSPFIYHSPTVATRKTLKLEGVSSDRGSRPTRRRYRQTGVEDRVVEPPQSPPILSASSSPIPPSSSSSPRSSPRIRMISSPPFGRGDSMDTEDDNEQGERSPTRLQQHQQQERPPQRSTSHESTLVVDEQDGGYGYDRSPVRVGSRRSTPHSSPQGRSPTATSAAAMARKKGRFLHRPLSSSCLPSKTGSEELRREESEGQQDGTATATKSSRTIKKKMLLYRPHSPSGLVRSSSIGRRSDRDAPAEETKTEECDDNRKTGNELAPSPPPVPAELPSPLLHVSPHQNQPNAGGNDGSLKKQENSSDDDDEVMTPPRKLSSRRLLAGEMLRRGNSGKMVIPDEKPRSPKEEPSSVLSSPERKEKELDLVTDYPKPARRRTRARSGGPLIISAKPKQQEQQQPPSGNDAQGEGARQVVRRRVRARSGGLVVKASSGEGAAATGSSAENGGSNHSSGDSNHSNNGTGAKTPKRIAARLVVRSSSRNAESPPRHRSPGRPSSSLVMARRRSFEGNGGDIDVDLSSLSARQLLMTRSSSNVGGGVGGSHHSAIATPRRASLNSSSWSGRSSDGVASQSPMFAGRPAPRQHLRRGQEDGIVTAPSPPVPPSSGLVACAPPRRSGTPKRERRAGTPTKSRPRSRSREVRLTPSRSSSRGGGAAGESGGAGAADNDNSGQDWKVLESPHGSKTKLSINRATKQIVIQAIQ